MNKSQLINSLAEETTFSKKDVVRLLDNFARIVQRVLKSGGKVQWAGFGTWSVTCRPARNGINPKTRSIIQLPPVHVTKFKPGKDLREAVRSIPPQI